MFDDLANKSFTEKEAENTVVNFTNEPIKTERLPQPPNFHAVKAIEKLSQRRMRTIEIKKEELPPLKEAQKEADDDDTFVTKKNATPINGKDKVLLKFKVSQMKKLFPDKLKGFKVNEKASDTELKNVLEEMEMLINLGSYDTFLTSSILAALESVEPLSALTKFNITGTAQLLRQNPQFDVLMKQLFLKYNVYKNIPIEYQLILLVSITASFAMIKNKQASQNFFDKPN